MSPTVTFFWLWVPKAILMMACLWFFVTWEISQQKNCLELRKWNHARLSIPLHEQLVEFSVGYLKTLSKKYLIFKKKSKFETKCVKFWDGKKRLSEMARVRRLKSIILSNMDHVFFPMGILFTEVFVDSLLVLLCHLSKLLSILNPPTLQSGMKRVQELTWSGGKTQFDWTVNFLKLNFPNAEQIGKWMVCVVPAIWGPLPMKWVWIHTFQECLDRWSDWVWKRRKKQIQSLKLLLVNQTKKWFRCPSHLRRLLMGWHWDGKNCFEGFRDFSSSSLGNSLMALIREKLREWQVDTEFLNC